MIDEYDAIYIRIYGLDIVCLVTVFKAIQGEPKKSSVAVCVCVMYSSAAEVSKHRHVSTTA